MNYFIRIIICTAILVPNVFNAQIIDNVLIVNAPKANLHQYPTDTSKVICQITGGEEVTTLDTIGAPKPYYFQTIDKYNGYWTAVKYKEKFGYIYSRYLIEDFAIFEEGQHFDRIPMIKYFYGVYKTSLGDYLRPVNLVLRDERHTYYDFDTINVRAIRVNHRKDTSIMLIGTNKLIKEGIIGDFTNLFNRKTHDERLGFRHIKAGDIQAIFCKFDWLENNINGRGTVYRLQAEGSFQMQSNDIVYGNSYKLFVTYHYSEANKHKSIKQDITQFIKNIETSYSVEIVYFGDLDGDEKPDVMLRTCEEYGCTDYILLSSFAREGELLRLASTRFYSHD